MSQSTCSINGCDRRIYARQRCRGHYNQLIRTEIREPRQCTFCGDSFAPKDSRRTCCYRNECEAKRNAQAVRESRKRNADTSRWVAEKAASRRYPKACGHCAQTFMAPKRRQKYCSTSCAGKARRRKPRSLYTKDLVMFHPPPEPAVTSQWGTFHAGTCHTCGTPFVAHGPTPDCSPRCRLRRVASRRAAARRAYRARLASVEVEPVLAEEVFKADGYRCHICGRKTSPNQKAPHPDSPSLDHIIPLSKGGPHTKANTATACLSCNIRKGNTDAGQLRLFTY